MYVIESKAPSIGTGMVNPMILSNWFDIEISANVFVSNEIEIGLTLSYFTAANPCFTQRCLPLLLIYIRFKSTSLIGIMVIKL